MSKEFPNVRILGAKLDTNACGAFVRFTFTAVVMSRWSSLARPRGSAARKLLFDAPSRSAGWRIARVAYGVVSVARIAKAAQALAMVLVVDLVKGAAK